MSAGTTPTSTPRASGWIALLVLFGITSTIEAFTVAHVFRFLPLYLGTVHVPPAEVPAWTGYLNAAFFLFGLPLVPFWGVWSERYGRIPIIARSAFVEMVVFTVLWLAQNRWQAGCALLLVGFQLGNTGVMLTALRAVTPRGRVGFAISLLSDPVARLRAGPGCRWLARRPRFPEPAHPVRVRRRHLARRRRHVADIRAGGETPSSACRFSDAARAWRPAPGPDGTRDFDR